MIFLATDNDHGVEVRVALLCEPSAATAVAISVQSPEYATAVAAALGQLGLQLSGEVTAAPIPGVTGLAHFSDLFGGNSPLPSNLGGDGDIDVSYFESDTTPTPHANVNLGSEDVGSEVDAVSLSLRAQAQSYMAFMRTRDTGEGASGSTHASQVQAGVRGADAGNAGTVSLHQQAQQALGAAAASAVALAVTMLAFVVRRMHSGSADGSPHFWQAGGSMGVQADGVTTPNPISATADALAMETNL
jgi:hypothetical protein